MDLWVHAWEYVHPRRLVDTNPSPSSFLDVLEDHLIRQTSMDRYPFHAMADALLQQSTLDSSRPIRLGATEGNDD